ncbi:MAG TPA: DUF2066 domain-containing protein [Rhodanobacteraceae bacterium]|jgi:hypothetical protein|nr:DUF2066 domain-containing protein [Rhodanobacteraceae bacterium]
MRSLMAALLALALLFAAGAHSQEAAPGGGTYSAVVPVTDTSDAARDAALSTALAQVLQQLAPQVAPGADVLGQAPGLVRNYKYQRAATGNGLQLEVDFDPGSIRHLVQQLDAGVASAAAAPGSGSTSAAPLAVAAGGSGAVWVDGLNSSTDFASMLSTLRGSPQLHNVVPVAAQNDGVLLQLDYDAPLPEVLNGLIAGGHLQAAPAHPGADASLHWVH